MFERSIAALKDLNAVGYGVEGTGLELDLMYNPGGAFLPPSQETLEVATSELRDTWGGIFALIHAHQHADQTIRRLFTSRGKMSEYMSLLVESFNVAASVGVMCRDLITLVGWKTHDCDFNQQLDMPVRDEEDDIRFRIAMI